MLVFGSAKPALRIGKGRLFELHSRHFASVDEHGAGIGVGLGAASPSRPRSDSAWRRGR
jgi:hypothetical protein